MDWNEIEKELDNLGFRYPCFTCCRAKQVWGHIAINRRPSVICEAYEGRDVFYCPDLCEYFESDNEEGEEKDELCGQCGKEV